jgi:hypothetical protein
MSYTRVPFPPGVRNVRLRPPFYTTYEAVVCGNLVADRIDLDTWIVYDHVSGEVEAVFRGAANGHGWSPSQAHAVSYINKANPINPFDLDSVP